MAILRYLVLALLALGWNRAAAAPSPSLPAAAIEHSFPAGALPEPRTVWVSLPAGYETSGEQRYDTLYVLDARGTLPLAAADAGLLAMAGETPPLIVVGIDSLTPGDRFRNFTPVADPSGRQPSAGGGGAFLKFVGDEVVPRIDRTYRTNGKRMLAGHSLAGLWVLHVALERPDLFQAYAAISPSLGWADQYLLKRFGERTKLDSAASSAASVFVSMADDAPAYLDAFAALQNALGTAPKLRAKWTLRRFPGETHVSTVAPALHAALRWRYPRDATP